MVLIVSTFNTPLGWLEITHDEQHIHRAFFSAPPPHENARTRFCNTIAQELEHYFRHPHYRFQLPLKPQGSSYQLRVWNALLVIPAGRTITYGELARQLQSSPRAVGQACKKNPLAVFIPCHRVVGKNNCGGYMGQQDALHYKLSLLKHEGVNAYFINSSTKT